MLRPGGSDRSLDEFATTTEGERLGGSRHWVGHWHAQGWLRQDLSVDRAAEILWARH